MITSLQIRNVLRVYGDQLKRRTSIIQDSLKPNQQPADLVSISMDARRKEMVSRMSNQLISQIAPRDHREQTDGESAMEDPPKKSVNS